VRSDRKLFISGPMTDKSINSMHCELLELGPLLDLTEAISQQVYDADFRPDLIIAIARGGLVPARFVADTLGISSIASVTVRHYTAGAKKNEGAFVAHPVNADIKGQRVLVVDDVNDTGDSFEVALPYIYSLDPAEVRTAVLHEKEVSSYRADYVGENLPEWRWLIYPWAAVEDLSSFVIELAPIAENRCGLLALLFDHYGVNFSESRLDQVLRLVGEPGRRFLC